MNKKGLLKICLVLFLLLFSYQITIKEANVIEINSKQNKYLVPEGYKSVEEVLDEYEHIPDILVNNKWTIGEDRYVTFSDGLLNIYINNGSKSEQSRYEIIKTYAIDESTEEETIITICFDMKIDGVNYDVFVGINRKNGSYASYTMKSEYFLNEEAIMDKSTTFETETITVSEKETQTEEAEENNSDSALLTTMVIIVVIVIAIAGLIVFKNVVIASRKY